MFNHHGRLFIWDDEMKIKQREFVFLIGFICLLAVLRAVQISFQNDWTLGISLGALAGGLGYLIYQGLQTRSHLSLIGRPQAAIIFCLCVIWICILWLPFGLFGFTIFIQASIPLSGSAFTWLTINRYPIIIILVAIYLVLLFLTLRVRKFLAYLFSDMANKPGRALQLAIASGSLRDAWRSCLQLVCMLIGVMVTIVVAAFVNAVVHQNWLFVITKGIIVFGASFVNVWMLLRLLDIPVSLRVDRWHWPLFALLFGFCITMLIGGLSGANGSEPRSQMIIVHRGVINHNGVGNTIAALEKSSQAHFPYIEMDIQETSDHQFICAHDNGVRIPGKGVQEIDTVPLSTIRKYHRVELFRDYLRVANRVKQPLIIELKVTNHSDKLMGTRFADKFKAGLTKLPHRVHSIGYPYLRQIKQQIPSLKIGLVTMLNVGDISKLNVDFYTMEHLTLTNYMLKVIKGSHRPVYTWTDNSHLGMIRSAVMGVDGQVTGQAKKLASLKINLNRDRWVLLLNFLKDYL